MFVCCFCCYFVFAVVIIVRDLGLAINDHKAMICPVSHKIIISIIIIKLIIMVIILLPLIIIITVIIIIIMIIIRNYIAQIT